MFSLKVTGEDLHKSTYHSFYSKVAEETIRKKLQQGKVPETTEKLAPSKSKQSFDKQKDEKFHLPAISHKQQFALCLGLGTSKSVPLSNIKKSIVRDLPPQDQKIIRKPKRNSTEKPLTEYTLAQLLHSYTGIATTERENRKYCLPIPDYNIPGSTLEKNADMVRYRPKQWSSEIGDWQLSGRSWDRLQPRKQNFRVKLDCLQKLDESRKRRKQHSRLSRKKTLMKMKGSSLSGEISLASSSKERQIPGYAGYIPMDPVECTYDPKWHRYYKPTTRQTYQSISSETYDGGEERHSFQHSLSSFVSPVPPCNPFRSKETELSDINKKRFVF